MKSKRLLLQLKNRKYLTTIEANTERKKRIHRFINQNMAFMNAKDESRYFSQFLRYTLTLDGTRNTNIVDIVPEFGAYT